MPKTRHIVANRNASIEEVFPNLATRCMIKYYEALPHRIGTNQRDDYERVVSKMERETGGNTPSHCMQFLMDWHARKWNDVTSMRQELSKVLHVMECRGQPYTREEVYHLDNYIAGYKGQYAKRPVDPLSAEKNGGSDGKQKGDIDYPRLQYCIQEAQARGDIDTAEGFETIYGLGGRGVDITRITAEDVKLEDLTVGCTRKGSEYDERKFGKHQNPIVSEKAFAILARRMEGRDAEDLLFPDWKQDRANNIIKCVATTPAYKKLFSPSLLWATHCIRHGVAAHEIMLAHERCRIRCGWAGKAGTLSATVNNYGKIGREANAASRVSARNRLATAQPAVPVAGGVQQEVKVKCNKPKEGPRPKLTLNLGQWLNKQRARRHDV